MKVYRILFCKNPAHCPGLHGKEYKFSASFDRDPPAVLFSDKEDAPSSDDASSLRDIGMKFNNKKYK